MDSLLNWGVGVILWLQQFSPALDTPFRAVTFMGEEMFFLLFLPVVYWCFSRRTGARLVILFFISAYLNLAAKLLFNQPRPFEYDPRVKKLADASGPGLPSGHTQGTVVVWGYLGTVVRRTWFWVIVGALMVVVPLSRIYLGVHFPTDVLGGYLLGALILLAWMWWGRAVEEWLAGKDLSWQLVLAVAIPLLMMALIFTDDGVSQGAALMGMGVGFIFERRYVGFDAGGVWWKRALRFLLGAVVLFGLFVGLKALFAGLTTDVNGMLVLRFVRYGLVGLWGGGLAPWLFVKIGLAERQGSSDLALP